MFLSIQTFEGIQTTVLSLIECVKFLLCHGFKYVLTNKISQDSLEDHFGRHRSLARRSTNPTLQALGFQETKLRLQRSIATSITPKANTKGSKRPTERITISHSPLKKRKKVWTKLSVKLYFISTVETNDAGVVLFLVYKVYIDKNFSLVFALFFRVFLFQVLSKCFLLSFSLCFGTVLLNWILSMRKRPDLNV